MRAGSSPSVRDHHDHDHEVYHRRLDMWWLGLALFLICIIEVRRSPSFSTLRLTNALLA